MPVYPRQDTDAYREMRGSPEFKGDDYVPSRDEPRLLKQFDRVWNVMRDGTWHTIAAVSQVTGDPPQSVARQIRYIRSPKRGGYSVERRHDGGGLYSFRVVS